MRAGVVHDGEVLVELLTHGWWAYYKKLLQVADK
jgi:hypothetical protein